MESESYDKASTKEKNIFGERFFKFYLNAWNQSFFQLTNT